MYSSAWNVILTLHSVRGLWYKDTMPQREMVEENSPVFMTKPAHLKKHCGKPEKGGAAMALAQNCGVLTVEQGRERVQHGSALFPIACYEERLTCYSVDRKSVV